MSADENITALINCIRLRKVRGRIHADHNILSVYSYVYCTEILHGFKMQFRIFPKLNGGLVCEDDMILCFGIPLCCKHIIGLQYAVECPCVFIFGFSCIGNQQKPHLVASACAQIPGKGFNKIFITAAADDCRIAVAVAKCDAGRIADIIHGQHRFILPEEEQEEVFSRVPIELFRKDEEPKTVPAPELNLPAEKAKKPAASKYVEEEEEVFLRPAPVPEETPAPAPAEEPAPAPAEETPAEEVTEEVTELEMKENLPPPYVFPPISLLTPGEGDSPKPTAADVAAVSRKLEAVLESFKVKAHVIGASFGPTVTQYEVQPETGVRVKQIANLSDDLALHLAAPSVRIENIPGKSAIGIEIPNRSSSVVRLRRLIENSGAF